MQEQSRYEEQRASLRTEQGLYKERTPSDGIPANCQGPKASPKASGSLQAAHSDPDPACFERCLTSSNKKLVETSATLVVTGALLVVTVTMFARVSGADLPPDGEKAVCFGAVIAGIAGCYKASGWYVSQWPSLPFAMPCLDFHRDFPYLEVARALSSNCFVAL